jgi:uncharacterized DUF497 family protein
MITFDFIEWDEHNEEHIALNGVTLDEVEEVLCDPKNRPAVSRSTGRRAVIGETSTGKTLFVAYDVMGDKSFTIIRPARPTNWTEERDHERTIEPNQRQGADARRTGEAR